MPLPRFINWQLTISSFLLFSTGLLVIFSSSTSLAILQLIFIVFGIIFYLAISQIDYRALGNLISPLFFLVLILLIIVLILGFESRGSVRWIPLGLFNLQPSELAKPILILFLARFFVSKMSNLFNLLRSLLLISPFFLLVFIQPDLGTTLTIGAIWLGMVFATKLGWKKIITLVIILLMVFPFGWFTLRDYQKQRIATFIAPGSDPLGVGYNVIQSTIAVGSGQFFGRGLGHGTQSRLQFLPEYRTDFIFAAIAEELGFLGSTLILLLYLFLISYCLKVASDSADYFGSLIATGVAVMLLFQTFVNIGMNIGLLPITGITLPLISYGGSSLIATMVSLGLVASVSRHSKKIDIKTIGS